ncbi:Glu/Leu/Phe/Val dehydrogenase [Candidatus Saccharibacteria bacterium]|nr:Glu/Leu/Phe/Val dehydrogenase [Candidatus Saccharibacteria bacterium]
MLKSAHNLVKSVGKKLKLDDATVEKLLKADAEHQFEISLKSGKQFKAYRVQHSNKLGPYKGGIRFHPRVNLDEIRTLATLMSLKTAAVGLPLGGSKGGVTVDPKVLTQDELEELSRKYVQHLQSHIGPAKDVPAPDVNTNAQIMDWMIDEYQNLTGNLSQASFTGKSLTSGGSEGRDEATGRGGVIALRELLMLQGLSLQHKGDQVLRFAVQGFGNVGSNFAIVAEQEQPNWKLIAASDSGATIFDSEGLSASSLAAFKKQAGRFSQYKNAQVLNSDAILFLEVDVLVLAALEDAITNKNMQQVKARLIVELANGPINETAYGYLAKKGITVLPDIITNAGGVIVSYLEWLQNKADERWTRAKVNTELEQYMIKAISEVYKTSSSQNLTLKEAAIMLALKRLT